MLPEPILTEDRNRFTLYPIKYQKAYKWYKDLQKARWVYDELSGLMAIDKRHFAEYLNDDERYFIKYILAFFASSDGIVNENLVERFRQEIKVPEIKAFYSEQISQEETHNETYSELIKNLIPNTDEQLYLFEAIDTIPIIKKKGDWALKWINSDRPFAERLIAFAAIEGISFSGAFCAIFWLRKRTTMQEALLPGLVKANQFISRDEGFHRDFGCFLYRELIVNKLSNERIYEIINELVQLEIEFCTESLPVGLIGMNATLMTQYIKYVADHLLTEMGVKSLYDVDNPFPWIETISMPVRENGFEQTTSNYQNPHIADRMYSDGIEKFTQLDDF